MPRERFRPAVVEMSNYLFVIGGMVLPEEDVGTVDIFDMQICQWVSSLRGLQIPDMPEPRTDPVACASSGRVYVLGGMQAGPIEIVECLDLWSNTWCKLPDMKEGFAAAGTAITCV